MKPVLYYREVKTGGYGHQVSRVYRVTNPQNKIIDSFLYVRNLRKIYGSRYTLIKKSSLV